MLWWFWVIFGFALATLFWGVLAHKYPALFANIVSQGATVVNKVDSTVKAEANNVTSTPNT